MAALHPSDTSLELFLASQARISAAVVLCPQLQLQRTRPRCCSCRHTARCKVLNTQCCICWCRARVAAIGAGAGLWPEVAKGLPGRTSKSCAERCACWQVAGGIQNPAVVGSGARAHQAQHCCAHPACSRALLQHLQLTHVCAESSMPQVADSPQPRICQEQRAGVLRLGDCSHDPGKPQQYACFAAGLWAAGWHLRCRRACNALTSARSLRVL